MKHLLLFFILPTFLWGQVIVHAPGIAQRPVKLSPQDTIERNVLLNIVYEQTDVDTVLKERNVAFQVLQLGQRMTSYDGLMNLLTDSLCYARQNKLLYGAIDSLMRRSPPGISHPFTHMIGTTYFLEQKSIAMNRYQAMDTAVVWNWTMHPDTMRVCGYLCHKATAEFRGRIWTAWWTEDLPYPVGPWKLCGLPGVILRASDHKGTHILEATRISKPAMPIIVRISQGYMTVSLKVLHDKIADYCLNPGVYAATMGVSASQGSKLRSRLFYSPYEE